MTKLITILLVMMSTNSLAGPDDATWNPAKQYDHKYPGHLIEHKLPQAQVEQACRKLFKSNGYNTSDITSSQRGCAVQWSDTCVIVYVDKTFQLQSPSAVRRHEIGHCNGWPANHPEN